MADQLAESASLPPPKAEESSADASEQTLVASEVKLDEVKAENSLLTQLESDIVRRLFTKCDPKFTEFDQVLREHGAAECWHKHNTFLDHLVGVWQMLVLWKQSNAIARCGLMHSAYSNSYVNLAIFKPGTDREYVRGYVGEEAESLIEMFCTIPRQQVVFQKLLPVFPEVPESVTVSNIRTGEDMVLDNQLIQDICILTIADFADQLHGWQADLFEIGTAHSLWPGDGQPGLYMSMLCKLASIARTCGERGASAAMPPVFAHCTQLVTEEAEEAARGHYWDATTKFGGADQVEECLASLAKAVALNPFIGEPHLVAGQLHLLRGDFAQADASARAGLRLLLDWGTQWDKRVCWGGWVAWARIIIANAASQTWPDTCLGMMTLGMVQ